MTFVIAFDLGGVLFSDGTAEFVDHLHRAYAVDPARSGELLHGELGSAYREGRLTRQDFWYAFRESLQLTASEEDLAARWIDGYRLNVGTRDLIADLAGHYDVYYLSDNVADRIEAVERRYGFLRLFKGGVFSHEAGVRKPNRAIYERLLDIVGGSADQVIYVDDKEWALTPAAELGMITILFRDSDQVRRDVQARISPRSDQPS
ncbi:MAG: HAD-IA family hydrolase [Hamadaea sp.]|uniref:HAD-IA family hydrolase n=1 Tax=Hamadaea sp. TaxID=2024425 RepID=UPI001851F76C|nr:HAD-IA family hydrolase [Hamadaea sp.]NUT20934.1 HAD-IA family hydrolase [Hamadaea sp.]